MDSINFIVHVAATVAFFGFLFALAKERKKRDFILTLLASKSASPKKLVVDWPVAYLDKFCGAFAVSLERGDAKQAGKPNRVEGEKLFDFYLEFRPSSIRSKMKDDGLHLSLKTVKLITDVNLLELQLSQALGVKVHLDEENHS